MTHQEITHDNKTISLTEEFDLEDYQKDQIEIELSSTKIEFPFFQIYKYSDKIQRDCRNDYIKESIKQQINEIQHKLGINDNSIKIFINLLKDEKIAINNECYIDLIKLSHFYEVHSLIKCLNKYAHNHSNDIEFAIEILHSICDTKIENVYLNQINMSDYEQILSDKINQCKVNDKFNILQISTIHRIIKKCDKNEINHDFLLDFILNRIDERCVLLSFLNLNSINEESFNKLYSKYHDDQNGYFDYLHHNLDCIKELQETKRKLEDCIKKLELTNNEFVDKTNELTMKNDQLLTKLNDSGKQIEELSRLNEANKTRINDQESSNDQLQRKVTDVVNENKKLQAKINEQESKFNEINAQLQQLKNEKIKLEKQNSQTNQNQIFKNIPFQTELSGIFDYLNKNSNLNDEIQLTSSRVSNGKLENIIRLGNNSNICSIKGNPDPWICFEFQKHKIILSDYTIRSYQGGSCHPRSWIIEGSDDLNSWSTIDEQKDCRFMKGNSGTPHVHTFQVSSNKSFKYIRMTQKGQNWGSDPNLHLNCIEFYGKLL